MHIYIIWYVRIYIYYTYMYLFRHLNHIYLPAMLTDALLPSLGQAKEHSEMLPGNTQNSRWIEIFSIFSQYLDVSGISPNASEQSFEAWNGWKLAS